MDINDLMPDQTPVETSIGTLYVRHRRVSDLHDLEALGEGSDLGRAIAAAYSSDVQDKWKAAPISLSTAAKLSDEDVKKILTILARRCGLKDAVDNSDVASLGELIKQDIEREAAEHNAQMEGIRKRYASLGAGVASTFQDQALKRAEMFRSPAAQIIEAGNRYNPALFENPMLAPIRDSANSSRATARKIDELAGVIGGLHSAITDKFLPTWMDQVQSGERQTANSLALGRSSLRWAKIAVFVTLSLSLASLLYQIWSGGQELANLRLELRNAERAFDARSSEQDEVVRQQAIEIDRLRDLVEERPTPNGEAIP